MYTPESYLTRTEIAKVNGHNNTFFAGAYLGNVLHEGAVASALAVSELLGGNVL